MIGWLMDQLLEWLDAAMLALVTDLTGFLLRLTWSSPDVTASPPVRALTATTTGIVNACFVLFIIAAGAIAMTYDSVQVRYHAKDLAPRLVVGLVAANAAPLLTSKCIEVANALTEAVTGQRPADPLAAVGEHVRAAVDHPLNALLLTVVVMIVAVLTVSLIFTFLVRFGVLVVLAAAAPLALACHALPHTEAVARLWWRSLAGCLGIPMLQGLLLGSGMALLAEDPGGSAAVFGAAGVGLPPAQENLLELLVVVALLWCAVKIPSLMRRYVTRGGGSNLGSYVLRVVLVQQVARGLGLRGGSRGGARPSARPVPGGAR